MADTPLESVPDWSEEQVARLRAKGIVSAQGVVAIGATQGGLESLAEELEVSVDDANRLVESARKVLTPAERETMEEVVDTSEFGLGAIPPQPEPEDGQ
jgi:hypothetical protein